ncbi:MAG: SCO family protein [Gammaproteobacteria bacterium]|nr:SCO family protein [Gammaproteobacteria bacterium]
MSSAAQKNTRSVLLIILAIVIVASIALLAAVHRGKAKAKSGYPISSKLKVDGAILPKPEVISDFVLSQKGGKVFNKASLKNHWTLLFFGFTNCGYVCPTTMAALGKMYKQLEAKLPKKLLPEVVMISVDPARDSVKRITNYVKTFDPHFIGVRGSMQQTQILSSQMKVVFAKVKLTNGNYTVSHSAAVMLLDPNANLRAFFSFPHKPAVMVHDYTSIVMAVS